MSLPAPAPFVPRPAQARVLAYTGGAMGVSAVPGSGKTAVLSQLAAQLVARLASEGRLAASEVLVVTFTNSAVENFRERIGRLLHGERRLLPGMGYRVRTLHGLAHDMVRERPALVGLGDDYGILDDRTTGEIKRDLVIRHVQAAPEAITGYLDPKQMVRLAAIESAMLEDSIEAVTRFIRLAKELRRTPAELRGLRDEQRGSFPLFDLGLAVYTDYQRALERRGSVDFDDLIVLALRALENDRTFLARLQDRWPYVLEDEAQDSSLLQEQMLRQLTRSHGNWVRVGDPNQAINTTFTGASTHFLQRFLDRPTTLSLDMPNSGRSALPIIELANDLIDWSRAAHPVLSGSLALALPHIQPAVPGDPQPNPPPGTPAVYLFDHAQSAEEEVDTVARSLRRWLPLNPESTVAVLAPENHHGFRVTGLLEQMAIPFDDTLLRTDASTRAGAQALATLVGFVAHPQISERIATIWRELWWPQVGALLLRQVGASASPMEDDAEDLEGAAPARTLKQRKHALPDAVEAFGRHLANLREPETFVFPSGRDWLDDLAIDGRFAPDEELRLLIERFRRDLQRWSAAVILPVDELVLTLGNDIFTDPLDLALAHRLALLLEQMERERPHLRLPDLAAELEAIADNRRRFPGLDAEGEGYVAKPGVVTVGTMHSAKGLEWDRVYLLGVSNYAFPSGGPEDGYRGERWYLRSDLNLVAEMEAQLRALAGETGESYTPGEASRRARVEVAAERLRLLYVGITRARRELILSWNTGRQGARRLNRAALAFDALLERAQGRASIS